MFTHDIVLLHDLISDAEKSGAPIMLRRLRSNRGHSGLVSEGLPWIAAKDASEDSPVGKGGWATQGDYDAGNDEEYEGGICRVYDRLRATVECAVEEWVFRTLYSVIGITSA